MFIKITKTGSWTFLRRKRKAIIKSINYQKRFYRNWVSSGGLLKSRIAVQETDLQISSDQPIDLDYCCKRIKHYRSQIQSYITRDERFLTSLKPVPVETIAPAIVRDMAAAARKANVGPMAAVAGAIAQYVGMDILKKGCCEVIIENGGDIFLRVAHPVKIGIYAGTSALSGRLRLLIRPSARSLGICASSGTVGHSLSFGKADSVIIVAASAALADAVATATANRVNTKDDFPAASRFARTIRGVSGVLIIVKSSFLSWGEIELA
jgi:ApbE superfamily uncharacterized protein (UPF0280 family)